MLAIRLGHELAAQIVAIGGVVDALRREKLGKRTLGRRLAPIDQLEHRRATIGLDRADDVARLGIGEGVEVLVIRGVAVLEPAEIAAELAGEVVAHLGRHRGEVLARLDPIHRRLGLFHCGRLLLLGGLVLGIGVLGERLDEDEAGPHELRQSVPLGHLGIDLRVGDADTEVAGADVEHGSVDQRGGGVLRHRLQRLREAVDLLLDELVARALELALELDQLRGRLRRQDVLTLIEVGTIEGRLLDRGDRAEMCLPVAVPGGRPEDAERQRDGEREADDDELLGAQLILPAGSVLAVEDRSRSEAHRQLVMRRLGGRPGLAMRGRGAILADAFARRTQPALAPKATALAPQRLADGAPAQAEDEQHRLVDDAAGHLR